MLYLGTNSTRAECHEYFLAGRDTSLEIKKSRPLVGDGSFFVVAGLPGLHLRDDGANSHRDDFGADHFAGDNQFDAAIQLPAV